MSKNLAVAFALTPVNGQKKQTNKNTSFGFMP